MIKIIYEDNHLLVVEKPINIPTQQDNSGDLDFLNMLKDFIKKRDKKPGNVYLGLIHRLDRPVGGIMVFAKTSKSASRLSEQVRSRTFTKTYVAVLQGKINTKGTFVDRLLKDTKTNMVKVDGKGKEAILGYELIEYKDGFSLVRINLKTGRSHQIRVQFSYHGYPLYGDQRYNSNSKIGQQIALFSDSITFKHPITKEKLTFKLPIPKRRPWNLFENVN